MMTVKKTDIKSKIILSFILSTILGVSAFADMYKVKVESSSTLGVYQSAGSTIGHFEKKSTYDKNKSTYTGDGVFSSINGRVDETVDTKVAGIDYKGHSYLDLIQKEGALVLVLDDEAQDDTGKVVSSSKLELEVKFAKGSFETFTKGEAVEIVLTDAGIKRINDFISEGSKSLLSGFDESNKKLMQQLGFSKLDSKINEFSFTEPSKYVFSGTSSKLNMPDLSFVAEVQAIFTK